MGRILETKDDVLGLEERRESFIVLDLLRKDAPMPTDEFKVERRLRENRYDFSIAKRNGESWLDCGSNLYKAEITTEALNAMMASKAARPRISEHIFANADGEIEVSKDFLRRVVAFFDVPGNRELLEDR